MLSLKAKIREKVGRGIKELRKNKVLPAVLYGPEIENLSLEVPEKDFEKIYQEAGESSLVKLKIKNEKSKIDEVDVLIHQIAKDPVKGKFLHVDFYHPSSRKEVEAEVPLVFEGEAKACKELGGTLVKEIQAVEVKGLAQNLPREIKVDISGLRTFEDRILIGDLKIPEGVKVLRSPREIVANVAPPTKEEEEVPAEEAEKPTEEKAEEGKAEEEEKAEEGEKKEKAKEKSK
ncbi:50S ribosomal protein L25 [Patescibacteria group bacterium]|nr:50S ribosomal protein L25 [Patescibacteria group bacterium]